LSAHEDTERSEAFNNMLFTINATLSAHEDTERSEAFNNMLLYTNLPLIDECLLNSVGLYTNSMVILYEISGSLSVEPLALASSAIKTIAFSMQLHTLSASLPVIIL